MICTLLTDTEKPVRDQAFKVSKGFIQKLEQVSEDPSLKEEMEAEVRNLDGVNWCDFVCGYIHKCNPSLKFRSQQTCFPFFLMS